MPARQGVFSGRNRFNVEGVTKLNLFDTAHENDPLGPKKSCRVLQTYENGLQNIVKLYLKVVETGREFFVRTSVGHRLYVLDHGFEHAQDVPIGARMINYNQQVVEVLAVELEPEPELVYNFEVEEAHTYFVGDDAECCVLGHNQDCATGSTWKTQNPSSVKKMMREDGLGFTDKLAADREDLKEKFIEIETKVLVEVGKEIAIGKATRTASTFFSIFSWFRKGKKASKVLGAAAAATSHADEVADAYKLAKAGGKHANFLKQYENISSKEIRKGIESLNKQKQLHLNKIANPEAHIPDFKDFDPRRQADLLNKRWPGDVQRHSEQIKILESIWKLLFELSV